MPLSPLSKSIAPEAPSFIHVDDNKYSIFDIRATGDVILDVTFDSTTACTKSIPADTIQKLKALNTPFPSARVFYRVRLDTLKKHSKYFTQLLGSDVFGEGRYIADRFTEIAAAKKRPSDIEADELPRIQIVDEDDATRTLGREVVFRDMLRIVHGAEHQTFPITLNYITILVTMADRYDCMLLIQRYVQGSLARFKYPITVDKKDAKSEELLRQKILVFYYTDRTQQLAAATKELIMRGSSRWVAVENKPEFTTAWWDLPGGLEVELAHRRACVLRTIASLQTHFLTLYTSNNRKCTLGYDSSAACDSFQLGEMIKFLAKKDLLSLIPFQAVSPEDPEYIWPDAYTGDIENLLGLLRQCPSYQIDKNHAHCGLRSKILPALDYIKDVLEGVGLKSNSDDLMWIKSKEVMPKNRPQFIVGGKDVSGERRRVFDLAKALSVNGQIGPYMMSVEKAAKDLFTAEELVWARSEADDTKERMAKSSVFRF